LVVVSLVLAGCAAVPTSGPIRQGPLVDSGESTQFIRVIAAPPSSGAKPEEIVRGFLEANASLEQGHAIARRYLTGQAAQTWDATASTTVYDPATVALSTRGDKVRVSFDVTGKLLADGTLVTIDPAEPQRITYALELVQEQGAAVPEWRISDPAAGVLISSADLRRAFRAYDAFFVADGSGLLVPDGRLVPVAGASLPTALAELVLQGPSTWLRSAVATGIPTGTRLALGAVPVTDGVAEVSLTEEALAATDSQRRDLAAQLTWTLTQLPEVSGVRIEVAGEPYPVPGMPELLERSPWQSRSPDALTTGPSGLRRPPHYVLQGRTIVRVSDLSRTSIPLTVEDADTLDGLAVALDEGRAAAVGEGGAGLWLLPLDGTSTAVEVPALQVTDISFAPNGQAWFADAGRVKRVSPSGQVADVAIRDEGLGPVTDVQVSRDGARVALLSGERVFVGAIVEDSRGIGIVAAHRVDSAIRDARALAWRDAGTLEVLGGLAGGDLQGLRVTIANGQVTQLGAPAEPQEVAAAPASVTLVSTGEDRIFGNVGLQWRDQGEGRSVAYPG
jgi:Lipoprotein LpqB beta-propeller domain/Sporulation and spore germination